MPQILLIPPEIILEANRRFTGLECDARRAKAVEACYSSFYYYPTLAEQLASIVSSMIKGHFFIDANKRTALYTYIMLSQLNGIKYVEDDLKLVDIFVSLAAAHEDIKECARLLYPDCFQDSDQILAET